MSATIWVKNHQDESEIRRIAGHRKVDIAIAILKHDGAEITSSEINRLMKYGKSGLCSIFHDDHYGKRIRVHKGIKHGGQYVGTVNTTVTDPADKVGVIAGLLCAAMAVILFIMVL